MKVAQATSSLRAIVLAPPSILRTYMPEYPCAIPELEELVSRASQIRLARETIEEPLNFHDIR